MSPVKTLVITEDKETNGIPKSLNSKKGIRERERQKNERPAEECLKDVEWVYPTFNVVRLFVTKT